MMSSMYRKQICPLSSPNTISRSVQKNHNKGVYMSMSLIIIINSYFIVINSYFSGSRIIIISLV